MFDNLIAHDSRPIALLKKAMLTFGAAFLILGIISSHRAYFQIRSLDLTSSDSVLRSGSIIQSELVSSGRTLADVQIELVQGAHVEKLDERRVPANEYGFFDPRTQSATLRVVLTTEILARFQSGQATIRATAFGHSQWTRVPPPVIRELTMEIGNE